MPFESCYFKHSRVTNDRKRHSFLIKNKDT